RDNPLGDLVSFLVSPRALSQKKALKHVQFLSWGLPLVDQYRTFRRIIPFVLQCDSVDEKRVMRCVEKVDGCVKDPELSVLRAVVTRDMKGLARLAKPKLARAIDLYTLGRDSEFAEHAMV